MENHNQVPNCQHCDLPANTGNTNKTDLKGMNNKINTFAEVILCRRCYHFMTRFIPRMEGDERSYEDRVIKCSNLICSKRTFYSIEGFNAHHDAHHPENYKLNVQASLTKDEH